MCKLFRLFVCLFVLEGKGEVCFSVSFHITVAYGRGVSRSDRTSLFSVEIDLINLLYEMDI